MPQWTIPPAVASEAVKIRCVESLPSIFEADVQSAVDEIMAVEGARIISVSPYTSVGDDPKPSAMITYAVETDQSAPGPARGLPVAPGEYLTEWIEEQEISQMRAVDLLGWSRAQFNGFVYGRGPVTDDMAVSLARVVGIPAESWLRYEAAYRADLARVDGNEAGSEFITLPVTEAGIEAAARELSPNPARWKDFVPTVRRVITAMQGAQSAR
jgi:plasmid maintenance system antidote protein VapI